MDTIEKLITPAGKILTAKPSDSLGSVLENVKSSHEPVFIYDKKNFVGMVSGSKSMFSKRYPKDTKAITAIINPPKLTSKSTIFETAEQMISTRVYTLPVFEKEKLIGVITVRSIFRYILRKKTLSDLIEKNLKIDQPLATTIHSKIRDVYSFLRKEKTSRMVVLDAKKALQGIITRRDIQEVFSAPPAKGRSSRTRNNRNFTIEDKDLKKFDFPIGEYMKVNVVTLPFRSKNVEIIKNIIDKKISSVVLLDKRNKPKGIVSIFSLLKTLTEGSSKSDFEIKISDKNKVIAEKEIEKIKNIIDLFAQKFNKKEKISFIETTLNAYRNINNKKTGYEARIRVHCLDGNGYMSKVEDKDLLMSVREALRKIEHQKGKSKH